MRILQSLKPTSVEYGGEILTLKPWGNLHLSGQFRQIADANQGETSMAITLGDAPVVRTGLTWDQLSAADRDRLVDLYYSPGKCMGMARSFPWQHPADGVVYAARFTGPMPMVTGEDGRIRTGEIPVVIVGKANLVAGDFSGVAIGATTLPGWVVSGTAATAEVIATDHGNMFHVATDGAAQVVTLTSAECITLAPGFDYAIDLPVDQVAGAASASVSVIFYGADNAEISQTEVVAPTDITNFETLTATVAAADVPDGAVCIKVAIVLQPGDEVGGIAIGGEPVVMVPVVPVTDTHKILVEDFPPGGTPVHKRVVDVGGVQWVASFAGDGEPTGVLPMGEWRRIEVGYNFPASIEPNRRWYAMIGVVDEGGYSEPLDGGILVLFTPNAQLNSVTCSVYAEGVAETFGIIPGQVIRLNITRSQVDINGEHVIPITSFTAESQLVGLTHGRYGSPDPVYFGCIQFVRSFS